MTLQQADYPDWLRVLSSVIPTPFVGGAGASVGGFPYNLTSGAVLGPFNVAPWPSLQFFFQPSTVDQRVVFTWTDDAAGTHSIGFFNFNMKAGLPLAHVIRNMGPYVKVQVISGAGGAISGSLWVGGSTRTTPGSAYQTSSFIVDWGASRVLAAGASLSVDMQYGYVGPAGLSCGANVPKWQVEVLARDILGNQRELTQAITASPTINGSLFCPALIVSVKVTNKSTVSGTFNAVVYQAQLP